MRVGGEQRHDTFGERARGLAGGLGEHHGGIGGKIAVGEILRRLERDAVDARFVRHHAVMFELLDGGENPPVKACKNVHENSRKYLFSA